jgi:hypothetical protein
MYNGEKTEWINQREFQYKDVEYGSASTIEVSTSINTKDFKYYSQLTLNISITSDSDKSRRNCNLYLQDVRRLFDSFKEVSADYQTALKNESVISNKYGKKYLEFKFKRAATNVDCILVSIAHSENDYGQIVIPLEDFKTVIHIFSTFYYNYFSLRKELKDQVSTYRMIESIKTMEREIRTLPSSLSAVPSDLPSLEVETPMGRSEDQSLLDQFIKDEEVLEKQLPEEEKVEAEQVQVPPEITSEFIRDVLKLDMANYEKLLAAASGEYNSTKVFIDRVTGSMTTPDDFQSLPGISEKDYKSAIYVSRFNYLATFKLYARDKAPVPISTPPIKYKVDPTEVHSLSIELAYDLLTISSYVKILSQKLSQKIGDSQDNKALFYYAHRCFTDLLCFSFLTGKEGSVVKNCVTTRFRDYEKAGFFKQYQTLLQSNNCIPVTEQDIQGFLDLLIEKVLPAEYYIDKLHDQLFEDRLLVPSMNNISLEQITNEVVKINVLHFVNELNINEIDLAQLNQMIDASISPEVFDVLRAPKKAKKIVEKVKYSSNLHFYFNKYKGDLPKGHKKPLVQYFEQLGDNDFPFNNPPINLEDLDERYIRALYHHNDLDGSKRNMNRSDFNTYVHEECTMTKRDILDKYKVEQPEEVAKEEPVDFGQVLDNISFD